MVTLNELSLLNQLTGWILCTDMTHKINYSNERYSYVAGFNNVEEILGTTPDELRCKAAECADIFIKQNQQVMNERATLKIIDIHPYRNDEIAILLTYKTPLLDNNNNVLGVLCQANEISQHALLNLVSTLAKTDKKYHCHNNINQRSYRISNKFEKSELTNREMECLFYYLRGKTAKEMASIFSISKRTVETHIANIKIKLDTQTRFDLIDKSIENNFINYIPERIMADLSINMSAIIEIQPQ